MEAAVLMGGFIKETGSFREGSSWAQRMEFIHKGLSSDKAEPEAGPHTCSHHLVVAASSDDRLLQSWAIAYPAPAR